MLLPSILLELELAVVRRCGRGGDWWSRWRQASADLKNLISPLLAGERGEISCRRGEREGKQLGMNEWLSREDGGEKGIRQRYFPRGGGVCESGQAHVIKAHRTVQQDDDAARPYSG